MTETDPTEAVGPMRGVKVVELGVWVAGPATAGVLADWGADVIKIEPPTGDPCRQFQRMLGGDMPTNPIFEMDNRSKRSIAVDLGTDDGLAIALELLADADVFVTNLRVGALARLGIDHPSVASRFPRLVYCQITGYGSDGEDADRAAYDVGAFWARSGLASLLTPPDGDPPFQRGGMGDHSTALAAAAAVSAALFERERYGQGQLVETSLIRQGAYTISFDLNLLLMWGVTLDIGDRASMGNPAMNNYIARCGRRFWIVGLEGERHWPPLARAVGHPEWLNDNRFAQPRERATNSRELISMLDEIFATRTLDEWADVFSTEPDFFWAPVNTPEELLNDPAFHGSGALLEVPDEVSTTTMVATPVDFRGTPWTTRSMAPMIGEHTREVLAGIGRPEAEIDALVASGTVVEPI
ncbi:MAG: CoA transferase [Acidimicrobiales bacterium]|nr:CoA transferase [Acidimicrobiales bacterium]